MALALRMPLVAVPTTYSGSEMTSRHGGHLRPDLRALMAQRIAATGNQRGTSPRSTVLSRRLRRRAGPCVQGLAVAVGQPGQGRRRYGRLQRPTRRPRWGDSARPRLRCGWSRPAPWLRPHCGLCDLTAVRPDVSSANPACAVAAAAGAARAGRLGRSGAASHR